jgi:uncharacterized protein (DUF1697 family)
VARQIVLLRGINLGARNRISMPELREALTDAGFDDVRTYVQSGNVVLESSTSSEQVARECGRVIKERFKLDVDVVVRTRAELARVVKRDPLADVVTNPKRYQVTFLAAKPDAELVKKLSAAAVEPEQVVHSGRELYAWHPDGVGRSKLAAILSGSRLGVTATARNWATVTKLLAMADE